MQIAFSRFFSDMNHHFSENDRYTNDYCLDPTLALDADDYRRCPPLRNAIEARTDCMRFREALLEVDGVVCLFDVMDEQSFEKAAYFLHFFRRSVTGDQAFNCGPQLLNATAICSFDIFPCTITRGGCRWRPPAIHEPSGGT